MKPDSPRYDFTLRNVLRHIEYLYSNNFATKGNTGDPVSWRPREFNCLPDKLCQLVLYKHIEVDQGDLEMVAPAITRGAQMQIHLDGVSYDYRVTLLVQELTRLHCGILKMVSW